MEIPMLLQIVKELGVSAGVFLLCAWMVMFIVKRLAITIDKLSDNMSKHEIEASARSKYIRDEHKQMIDALSRINGYHK